MEDASALLSSYLGLSFAVFLGFLPRSSLSHVASLQSRNRILSIKLFHAEEQLHQMSSRRKEDSKANARVVEIFASYRHAWQQEEKRFLHRIDAAADEIAILRSQIGEMERSEAELQCSVERLQGEVAERDKMLDLMSRRELAAREEGEADEMGKNEAEEVLDVVVEDDYCIDYERMGRVRVPKGVEPVPVSSFIEESGYLDDMEMMYCRENRFRPGFLPAAATSNRTESPNTEWQQLTDACEPSLSPDFRTQRQTVFLVEASALQHRAKEMRRKLNVLHSETAKSHLGDELTVQAKFSMRRSLDSVRHNFKEIQRNLEIWLARIMGDLEGILARESNPHVRDYSLSLNTHLSDSTLLNNLRIIHF